MSRDSLVHTWSVIKPVSAMCLVLAARRAEVPLDTPVAEVWPALRAAREHRAMTIGAVLAHRAGLVSVPDGDVAALCDTATTERALEAADPDWPPGTAAGEHALTYGHLVGGLLRRLDGRSLGTFLRDEIAGPLDLDIHVGLGAGERSRTVDLVVPRDWWEGLPNGRPALAAAALGRGVSAELVNSETWRRAEVPAVNGHATARGLARFWWLALDGQLGSELWRPYDGEGLDLVLGEPVRWSIGGARIDDDDDVGMGGVGGSYAGARPRRRLAWAFLTTVMGTHDRVVRVEAALLAALS